MRDFISPKKRDVFIRLRRRIDLYRQHQEECYGRYQPLSSGIYELQQQETLILHHKWLENKSKRSSKHLKGKECQPHDQKGTNVSGMTFKTKRRHEETNISPKFSSNQDKKMSPHVRNDKMFNDCLNIIQKPTSYSESSKEMQQSMNSDSRVISTFPEKEINMNREQLCKNYAVCKQEPSEDIPMCVSSSGSSQTSFPDIDDVDELQAILESLTEDGEEIPADLLREIDNGLKDVQQSSCSDADIVGQCCKAEHMERKSMACHGGMFSESSYGIKSGKFCRPENTPLSDYQLSNPHTTDVIEKRAIVPSQSGLLGDTGPAAETLKQMAAQHQCHYDAQYDLKCNVQPNFTHNLYNSCLSRESQNTELFECNMQDEYGRGTFQSYRYSDNSKETPVIANEKEMSYDYQTTKPLSHLGDNLPILPYKDGTSSVFSPQQLPLSRVQPHFNQTQCVGQEFGLFKEQQSQYCGNKTSSVVDRAPSPTKQMLSTPLIVLRQQPSCFQDQEINMKSVAEQNRNIPPQTAILQCKDTDLKVNSCKAHSYFIKDQQKTNAMLTMENLTDAADLSGSTPVNRLVVPSSTMEGTMSTSKSMSKPTITFPVISSLQDDDEDRHLLLPQQTNASIAHIDSSPYRTPLMSVDKPSNSSNVNFSPSHDSWQILYESLSSPRHAFPNITRPSDYQSCLSNTIGSLNAPLSADITQSPLSSRGSVSFEEKLCAAVQGKFQPGECNKLVPNEHSGFQRSASSLIPVRPPTQFMKPSIKIPAMQSHHADLKRANDVTLQGDVGDFVMSSCFSNSTIPLLCANYDKSASTQNNYIMDTFVNNK